MSLVHLYIFFCEIPIQVLCPFSNSVMCFLTTELFAFPLSSGHPTLSDVGLETDFPNSWALTLWIDCFLAARSFPSSMQYHLFLLMLPGLWSHIKINCPEQSQVPPDPPPSSASSSTPLGAACLVFTYFQGVLYMVADKGPISFLCL